MGVDINAPKVTLHVSVWVEIHWICKIKFTIRRHAPRERVSWNFERSLTVLQRSRSRSTWACELKYRISYVWWRCWSHAPRERVSWNYSYADWLKSKVVTLHVSVWVEITLITGILDSHLVTLHVSVWVEINVLLSKLICISSHAPRERVSWNHQYMLRN